MKPKHSLRHFLLLTGSIALTLSSVHAADVTWDTSPGTVGVGDDAVTGGTGTWDTTNGNWTTDGGANNIAWVNANNDTAIFGGTAGTVTLGANVTVGGITSNTAGYIIAPGTGPFGITFGAPGNINVSTGTTTIQAAISGSAITKTGNGTLRMDVVNSFNGLTLNGGTIQVGSLNDTLGAAGSTISVTANSTLSYGVGGSYTLNKALDIASGVTFTHVKGSAGFANFTGVLSGGNNTTVVVNDAGSINQRTLIFSNTTNTFTGAISLANNQSSIAVASLGDAAGSGNIIFGSNATRNGAFQLGTTAIAPLALTSRRIELIAGANAAGTAQINNLNTTAANTLTINSDLLVTGTGGTKTLQLGGVNTDNNTFAGNIANGGFNTLSVTKADAGKWILGGANTYSGNTTINAGHLEIGGSGTLGNVSTGVGDYAGNISINNTNSGRLVYNSSATQTLGGVVSGLGALVVEAGTLNLTNANSYAGGTLINAGTLLVNNTTGSGTGSGTVTVGTGGTLGGSGTVSGATTIAGFLNPGNSPGVLTFGNVLTLEGTTLTTMEINGLARGSQYDGVDVGTVLTYGGALNILFGNTFGAGADVFNLFDFGSQTGEFGTITISGAYTGSLAEISGGVWGLVDGDNSWSFDHGTGDLTFSVIPEPTTALLGGLGLLFLLRRRR